MKSIKGFEYCNRKKISVAFALSLLLSSAVSRASPCGYNLYTCNIFALMAPIAQSPTVAEWVLDASVGNVDFYHSITVCNGENVVFLKFNNKNNYPVSVNWKEVFKIKSGESKEGFSGKKNLILAPGINMPANCSDTINKKSIVLPAQVDPTLVTEILGFSFKDISVTNP